MIEEVDQFKREGSERGRNARSIARLLDELRERGGSLSKGVALDSGGMLRVAVPSKRLELPSAIDHTAMDQAILQTAFDVRENDGGRPTIFVTMDTNLRIRADALGMVAQTYENQRVDFDRLNSGIIDLEMDGEEVDTFFREGRVAPREPAPAPNTCVLMRDRSNPSHTALGRYDATKRAITALRVPREGVMGVRPRNKEQSFALDLLLDESIRLVTLVGKAGTGKTLLALAAGLKRTVEDGVYTRMLVSRPVMPLGRDIGFLPGDVDEKLNPWMQPIFDNLEFLFSTGSRKGPRAYAELLESGQIQVEPLTYIRGRIAPAAVHRRRRGAEPHAARGQDDHHPLRRRDEDRPDRRPGANRQPVRRQRLQRADHRRGTVPRREARRPHRPRERRAERARGAGGQPSLSPPDRGASRHGLGVTSPPHLSYNQREIDRDTINLRYGFTDAGH